MQKQKCTAIVLAAGQGKRMGTKVQKQYLEIQGKPVLYYSLATFESSNIVDKVILVVGDGQEEYCETEIVSKYGFRKVKSIVTGGRERYHSVWSGLNQIAEDGIVFIHDGARPFLTEEMLQRAYESVLENKACVLGMPVKDTIKISDEANFAKETPERKYVWQVQTPQVFDVALIKEAYARLMENENDTITDDAMVVETMLGYRVKLVEGSYKNIKITTPEDLQIAEMFLDK